MTSEETDLMELLEQMMEDTSETKAFEFPITVKDLEVDDDLPRGELATRNEGKLVKIRPCSEEDNPEDKTFLGIHLGQMQIGLHMCFSEETGILQLVPHLNPAIFVPSLGKIVWGMESWWGVIESEEELAEITDEDIQNVPYVKILRERLES